LEIYAPLVSKNYYLVAADTVLGHFTDEQTPTARSKVWNSGNDPYSALCDFLKNNTDFEPETAVNGKIIDARSPGGDLRRRKNRK
jgi:cephalosporin hydroxylase